MVVAYDKTRMINKYEEALLSLESKLKKNKSLRADQKKVFLKSLSSEREGTLKVVAGKVVLSPEYYVHFIMNYASDTKERKRWYAFFAKLKKLSYIHKRSSYFPKDFSLITMNPNLPSLYNTSLSYVNSYIHARKSLYVDIEFKSLNDKNALAYIDLRLYQMTTLYESELKRVRSQDIMILDDRTAILYIEDNLQLFNDIPHYRLSTVTGETLLSILKQNIDSGTEYPFSDITLEDSFLKYRKKHYEKLSISDIKLTGKNIALRKSSPLDVLLSSNGNILSMLTLSELNVMHPDVVPSHLFETEIERVLNAMSRPEVDDESGESEGGTFRLVDRNKFFDLLRTKTPSEFRKKVPSAKHELDTFLASEECSDHGRLIVLYILYLLERVDGKSKIEISTFKGYIGLLNKHLFNKVEDLSKVQTHELNQIISNLTKMQYKHKSITKIQAQIQSFFALHNQKHKINKINIASYPKSLIFKNELDDIIDNVSKNATAEKTKKGSRVKFKMLQMQSLVLIAFYTGLRKSELRSRLCKDIYVYGNKIYVDVNNNGMKRLNLKLKTSNAKRRVCTVISNDKHLKIITDFLSARMQVKNKSPYLFLEVKDDYTIKSKPILESSIDTITDILQGFTGRYVTFHSFRHSYATYEVEKILNDSSKVDPYKLIDLSVRMGHESPEITLKVYTHASVLDLRGVECY